MLWERRIGRLNASSPTYSRHRLYIVNLDPGHIVKLDAKTGKIIWKHSLPGRAESSPVVIGRTVYFGCEDGNLYALSTISGNVRWATALGGPVKSAPAYYGGTLYVGDYGGYMNAVDAKTGKLIWQSGSLGPGFGASGEFYSTPAVAFGRVYAGNNDDRVYSFDLKDGDARLELLDRRLRLLWPDRREHPPQPADRLHRLLRRQRLRARRQGRQPALEPLGRRPGGRLALGGRRHRLRRRVHQQHDQRLHDEERPQGLPATRRGTYTPVISDGRRIYLTGYSSITALQPYKYKGAVGPAIVAPKGKSAPKARPHPAGAAAPAAGPAQKQGKQGGAGRR